MPGIYSKDKFDLAGFSVGLASKKKLLNKKNVKINDLILAVPSSGVHSNGYSLIRYIIKKNKYKKKHFLKKTTYETNKIYVKEVLKLLT